MFSKILVVATIALFFLPTPQHCKASAKESSKSDPVLSREGKRAFADQLFGIDKSEHLPDWITANELFKLLFNHSFSEVESTNKAAENSSNIESLGVGKWPGRKDIYLAIGTIDKSDSDDPASNHAQLYVCAFKMNSAHSFEIVATLKNPRQFDCDDHDEISMEGGLDKFIGIDSAIYNISPSYCAVGLRLGHNEGYAGGIGYQENLLLLAQKDKTLTPVFNHMIYQMQWLAGDWNKDGSRQHTTEEKKFVAIVQSKTKNDFYPILVRQTKGGHLSSLYCWMKQKEQYQ